MVTSHTNLIFTPHAMFMVMCVHGEYNDFKVIIHAKFFNGYAIFCINAGFKFARELVDSAFIKSSTPQLT